MAKYLITTPIYYVNDIPHIGSAYTTLATDVLARANRQYGREVLFLTGTDEHGTKVAQKAKEAGQEPQAYADHIAADFKYTWDLLEVSYDVFARTTDQVHQYLVGQVMQYLHGQKLIYPGVYEGWYCVGCEEYKETAANTTTPPCPIHKRPLEFIKEEIYYFRLSNYQEKIAEAIESDTLLIEPPTRKNEVLSFLKAEDLRDIPITRSKVSWGIPVPFAEEQTVYVWFDALLNYLTFSGVKIDSRANTDQQTLSVSSPIVDIGAWPADTQLLGKDILRFHAVIWPAILLALGLPLPKNLLVHGFFTINGQKMSKSLGNVISPQELVERYGVEATRYVLLAGFPFGLDGDVALQKFDALYTAQLVNGLGNLLQRTLTLVKKYGPKPQVSGKINERIKEAYLRNDLTRAISETFLLVSEANKYLAAEQPWAMPNDALREKVLSQAYEHLQVIALALVPLMPGTAREIQSQLENLEPKPLFPRLDS